MKIVNLFLTASVLLLSGDTVAAGRRRPKSNKAGKGGKGSKSADDDTTPVIGEPEIFASYDFFVNESPESIVTDSKGNVYASLSLTAFISVLDPEGEEIHRIDMPQGYCRPEVPTDISFPVTSLQFGMAMSKDDVLFVALNACAEGFPQPPDPNPNTGLWMINTEDYSMTQVARIPNADGRGRQDFCCEWNTYYYSEGGPLGLWDSTMGRNDDGTCDLEGCAFYEAWYGSQLFGIAPFRGYAEIWNGLEVVGDCVYLTNSYFNEIQRACPTDDENAMWRVDTWMERGAIDTDSPMQRPGGTPFADAGLNGIKYFDGAFYVANTAARKLFKVPILPANSSSKSKSKAGKQPSIDNIIRNTGGEGIIPGTPELVVEGGDIDEFTFDTKGNIYAALFADNKVLKISPDGNTTTLIDGGPTYAANCPQFGQGSFEEDYEPSPILDMPVSVGFGTGPAGDMTLYVANSGFIFFKSCAGQPILKPDGTAEYYPAYPGITKISVGEKGAQQMW